MAVDLIEVAKEAGLSDQELELILIRHRQGWGYTRVAEYLGLGKTRMSWVRRWTDSGLSKLDQWAKANNVDLRSPFPNLWHSRSRWETNYDTPIAFQPLEKACKRHNLTARQTAAVFLYASGNPTASIATRMSLSEVVTAKTLDAALKKLGPNPGHLFPRLPSNGYRISDLARDAGLEALDVEILTLESEGWSKAQLQRKFNIPSTTFDDRHAIALNKITEYVNKHDLDPHMLTAKKEREALSDERQEDIEELMAQGIATETVAGLPYIYDSQSNGVIPDGWRISVKDSGPEAEDVEQEARIEEWLASRA